MEIPNENKAEETNIIELDDKNRRPLGLSLLLIFSFVFNGLLTLVMIAGLFYPDIVQSILQEYYKQVYISGFVAILTTLSGAVVFGVSFFGSILLWQFKRRGFFYYASAQAVMLIALVLILKSFDYINIGIALVVIIIFGMYARGMK